MFARAGLPSAECVAVFERAHREFMDQSGLAEDLHRGAIETEGKDADPAPVLRVRLKHLWSPIEGELNRQICEALIGLGAPQVAVLSEGSIRRHLKSIPEVKDAIREAWLSLEGLERQMKAASRSEVMPTWPIFVLVEDGPPV
jgi:hypothetical protein